MVTLLRVSLLPPLSVSIRRVERKQVRSHGQWKYKQLHSTGVRYNTQVRRGRTEFPVYFSQKMAQISGNILFTTNSTAHVCIIWVYRFVYGVPRFIDFLRKVLRFLWFFLLIVSRRLILFITQSWSLVMVNFKPHVHIFTQLRSSFQLTEMLIN